MASGPLIWYLPDMCSSSIDTCREQEHEAVQELLCLFRLPLLHFSLCFADARCQMMTMNWEARQDKNITSWLYYSFPIMGSIVLQVLLCWSNRNEESFKSQLQQWLIKCTNTLLFMCLFLCLPLSLSLSFRLSVSQCIPGVCGIHSMCRLAGCSVWRLHLVST